MEEVFFLSLINYYYFFLKLKFLDYVCKKQYHYLNTQQLRTCKVIKKCKNNKEKK
jgi:hypothetical protein